MLIAQITQEELASLVRTCVKEELSAFQPTQKAQSTPDDLMSESEACTLLKVSKVTLSKWRKEKKIPFYRYGSRIRYSRKELQERGKYGRTL